MNGLGKSGPETREEDVFTNRSGRCRRSEPELPAVDRDSDQFRDALDVDVRRRLTQSCANLHQQIGAACQDAGAGVGRNQPDRLGNRLRCFVTNRLHCPTIRQGQDSPATALARLAIQSDSGHAVWIERARDERSEFADFPGIRTELRLELILHYAGTDIMKRASGILAIAATALVFSSGQPASALEPQKPRRSNPPEKVATQSPGKTTQVAGKTTQVPEKGSKTPDKTTKVADKSVLSQQRAQIVRCAVPDLGGRDISDAKGILEKAHLSLGDVDRRRDSHRTGTIIEQSARPGSPIKCGSAVHVVAAVFVDQQTDPPACQVRVPDLFNADLRAAEKILAGQKLKLGDIQSKTDTRVKGTVIGQLPPRGTPVICGSVVTIVVAVPPEPPPCPAIRVPSVIGRDQETGIKLLNRAGIRVRNIDQVKSDAPTGTILRQSALEPLGKCLSLIHI